MYTKPRISILLLSFCSLIIRDFSTQLRRSSPCPQDHSPIGEAGFRDRDVLVEELLDLFSILFCFEDVDMLLLHMIMQFANVETLEIGVESTVIRQMR